MGAYWIGDKDEREQAWQELLNRTSNKYERYVLDYLHETFPDHEPRKVLASDVYIFYLYSCGDFHHLNDDYVVYYNTWYPGDFSVRKLEIADPVHDYASKGRQCSKCGSNKIEVDWRDAGHALENDRISCKYICRGCGETLVKRIPEMCEDCKERLECLSTPNLIEGVFPAPPKPKSRKKQDQSCKKVAA